MAPGQLVEHVGGHGRQVVGRLPAPLLARGAVVDGTGPRVGDFLPRVGFVGALKVRDVFLDLGGQLPGRKAHGRHVEIGVVLQAIEISLHQVDGALDTIGHVHHGQHSIGAHKAGVALVGDGFVIDGHRIVGRAATGQGLAADDARVTHPAHVHAKAPHIVVAQQLAAHLGDAIHRRRAQDGVLGRVVAGGLRSKHGNGAGAEDPHQLSLPGGLEDVVQAVDVDIPSQQRPFLAHGREHGGHVIDGVDLVLVNYRVQGLALRYVDELKRATFA